MTISMIDKCLGNFSETLDMTQTDDSKFGAFFHDYDSDCSFCGTIKKCNELNSRLEFSHVTPGMIHIDQIRGNEEK